MLLKLGVKKTRKPPAEHICLTIKLYLFQENTVLSFLQFDFTHIDRQIGQFYLFDRQIGQFCLKITFLERN